MCVKKIYELAEKNMHNSTEMLRTSLAKIRTGRAHTGILEHIQVRHHNSLILIKYISSINILDACTLSVQPYEREMIGPIEKAIRDSDLGLNPILLGETIRIPMPVLTEERRHNLVRIIKNEGENARVIVRNFRREANENLKKNLRIKSISKDEERRAQDKIQKLTNDNVNRIDKLIAQKETEIMMV